MPESAQEQVDRLAKFILTEVDGEPSENEGAIDTAIRLLRDAKGGSLTVVNISDPNEILAVINSPEGKQAIMNVISR